uniref:Uncharacterized protein n=1 Tax=Rheinheimera sp. BAL341 TaxID=1708203 RepID=A0A486XHW0_9GAMM
MLAFYQRWARRLYPFRLVFLFCVVAAVAGFFWLLFAAESQQAQRWQLSCVVAAIGGLLLWLWVKLFNQPIVIAPQGAGALQRLKVKLQHLLYYLLALTISLLILFTLYLGLRVLKGIIAFVFFS